MLNKLKGLGKTEEYFFMFLLRTTYLICVYVYLNNYYYPGTGSYGIDFDIGKEILAFIAFGIVNAFFVIRDKESIFTNVLTTTLHLLYFIPISCSYSLNNMDDYYFILVTLFCVFSEIAIGNPNIKVFRNQKKGEKNNNEKSDNYALLLDKRIRVFCLLFCIIIIIYKLLYNGLSINFFGLGEAIYGNRSIYSSYLSNIAGSGLSYFVTLLTNLVSYIAPFYLLISIFEKKKFHIVISTIAIVSLFSLDSQKGIILMIPVIIVVARLSKNKNVNAFANFLPAIILISIIYSIITKITFNYRSSLFSIFLRREMYLPSWLNTLYYKFFNENPKIMWSQNTFLLQRIIPDVYDTSPLNVISMHYFKGLISTPNTGMFADAYMNLGFLGIFIYPIIYRVLFRFSRNIYKNYGRSIECLFGFKVALGLLNINILRSNFVLSYILITLLLYYLPIMKIHGK